MNKINLVSHDIVIHDIVAHLNKIQFHLDPTVLQDEPVSFVLIKRKEAFEVPLPHLLRSDTSETTTVQLELPPSAFYTTGRFDIFLKTTHTLYRLTTSLSKFPEIHDRYFDYFKCTSDWYAVPYVAKNSAISIFVEEKRKVISDPFDDAIFLHQIRKKNNELLLTFRNESALPIQQILIKYRKADTTYTIPIKKQSGKYFSIAFSPSKMDWEQFYWDFYASFDVDDEKILLRVKNTRLRNKLKLQYFSSHYDFELFNGFHVIPYITINEQFSLNFRKKSEYETRAYKAKEITAYVLYCLFGWLFAFSKIWLVHEKFSETAQDNAFAFFKYLYSNAPEKRAYFVIKANSPDAILTKPYKKRVIHFMSIKHLFLLLVSKRIISSESKGHGYAWRVSQGFIRPVLDQKPFVFLQHGVLGLKQIDNVFRAHGMNHADLFVASSVFEKEIIKKYLGYADKNIMVTGLARWDEISERPLTTERKEILCMPTWRNWLEEADEDTFLNSEYFKYYQNLITSERLQAILAENQVTLNFYLHPKFLSLSHLFIDNENPFIRILSFGEEKMSQLITNSKALITDYSSVAWEYLYSDKPTIFFQFDINQYLESQGSYIDLKENLFGPIAYDYEALLDHVSNLIATDFKVFPFHQEWKSNYLAYTDGKHSKRILDAIVAYEGKETYRQALISRLKRNTFVRTIWRKVKKNHLLKKLIH